MPWLPVIVAVVVTAVVTHLSIWLSHRHELLDRPNHRSSHSSPVPRVGGIGIVSGFFAAMAAWWFSGLSAPELNALLTIAALFAAIGLHDDLRGLRPAGKYGLQLAAVLLAIGAGSRITTLDLPIVGSFSLGWLAVPVTILWITGFTNIFNFMDGINGISGTTAVICGSFFLLFSGLVRDPTAAAVALIVVATSLGFLPFNFPRARTFMGDTGSLFLGALLSLLVIQLGQRGIPYAALALVCSAYLYDSAFTLLRRMRRRENIFRAHRSHLYQRLIQAGMSHLAVTLIYSGLQVFLGALAVLYIRSSEPRRLGVVGVAAAVLVAFTVFVYRRERVAALVRHNSGGRERNAGAAP